MATSIYPLSKVQMGIESAKGNSVAATRVIVGDGMLVEHRDRYHANYPRGVRATVGGAGVLTKQWCEVNIDTELSAEQVLWPLLTGIKGAVSASAANNADTYTFTPQLTTGIPTLDTATVEFLQSDGSTNHYYGESAYCMTESFKIDSSPDQIAKLSWKMFGRARQTDTPTAALTPYTSLEPLPGALCFVYLDTTWAGLGGTQLASIVRSLSFECTTGIMPDWTMDGRSDLDFVKHSVGSLGAKLGLTLEFDATGASRYANYRANDLVYIRLKFTGESVGDASVKTVQIDGAYRFAADPTFSNDNGQVLMACQLEAVYDSTGTKILEFTVINGLSAVA